MVRIIATWSELAGTRRCLPKLIKEVSVVTLGRFNLTSRAGCVARTRSPVSCFASTTLELRAATRARGAPIALVRTSGTSLPRDPRGGRGSRSGSDALKMLGARGNRNPRRSSKLNCILELAGLHTATLTLRSRCLRGRRVGRSRGPPRPPVHHRGRLRPIVHSRTVPARSTPRSSRSTAPLRQFRHGIPVRVRAATRWIAVRHS